MTTIKSKAALLLLALILLLALAIRLKGIGFGLPYLAHPDEGYLLMPALKIISSGDWNPGRFEYGSLYIYSLVPAMATTFLYLARGRAIESAAEIVVSDTFRDLSVYPHPAFVAAGRAWTAVLAVATIALIYLIARQKWGRGPALLSAALLAALPIHSLYAHFTTVDVPATFMVTLTLFVLTTPTRARGAWKPLTVGLVTGLAISTKYSVFPLAGAVLLLYGLQRPIDPDQRWRNLAAMAVAIPAGFLIGSPFILVSLPEFLDALASQIRIYNPDQPLISGGSSHSFLADLMQPHHLFLFLAAAVGVGWLLYRRRWRAAVELTVFPMALLATIWGQDLYYDRNWLPLVPFLALAGGYGLWQLLRLPEMGRYRWRRGLTAAVVGLYLVSGFFLAYSESMMMTQRDIRQTALAELVQLIPPDSRVMVDLAAFVPPPGTWQTERITYLGNHDIDWYREQGFDYAIVTEPLVTDRNRPVIVAERDAAIWQAFPLVATFNGPMVHKANQHVWLLQIQ